MAEITNERKAEILDYKINEFDNKINAFQLYGISFKKTQKLQQLKALVEASRAEIPV